MEWLMKSLLQAVAAWLDRVVPGKGARHILVWLFNFLIIIGLHLVGQLPLDESAQKLVHLLQAGIASITPMLGDIFAAKHDPKPPTTP